MSEQVVKRIITRVSYELDHKALARWRKSTGLSMGAVARGAGISTMYYSHLERGMHKSCSEATFGKIAAVLSAQKDKSDGG